MPAQYAANLTIGGSFLVNDLSILYMCYRAVWDRGTTLDILIHDQSMNLHKALEDMKGDPTPSVEFQYEWLPSKDRNYYNKGTKHKLYILKVGLVTTPVGVCIRIRAVDKASILLRGTPLSYHATSVKAGKFVEAVCREAGISARMVETGDVAYSHRAVRAKPIDTVRYELDRVLSSGGKPISLQFDDRADQQILIGSEELYDSDTSILASLSGGAYNYGVPVKDNQGTQSTFGTTAYHFEMDQDFRPGIWGHVVSVNHLTAKGEQVTGEIKAKNDSKLGVQGDVLKKGGNRIQLPLGHPDNPTPDAYYAQAVMTNSVFQNEMATTSGILLVDADYKAFDDPNILNKKHVTIAITAGVNEASKHSIIPTKSVVMGWQHEFNRATALTRVLVRRGS